MHKHYSSLSQHTCDVFWENAKRDYTQLHHWSYYRLVSSNKKPLWYIEELCVELLQKNNFWKWSTCKFLGSRYMWRHIHEMLEFSQKFKHMYEFDAKIRKGNLLLVVKQHTKLHPNAKSKKCLNAKYVDTIFGACFSGARSLLKQHYYCLLFILFLYIFAVLIDTYTIEGCAEFQNPHRCGLPYSRSKETFRFIQLCQILVKI